MFFVYMYVLLCVFYYGFRENINMLVILECKNINVYRFFFLDFFFVYKRYIRFFDINWVVKFFRGVFVKVGNNFIGI